MSRQEPPRPERDRGSDGDTSESNHTIPANDPPPAILSTIEGFLKFLLGFLAGCLLLYMAYHAYVTGGTIDRRLVTLLGAFMLAFLGVDLWAVLRRVRGGP